MVAGATGWEGEGDYPWTKKDESGKLGDYPLEKYELDKNLSDLASKYIEEKGKEEVAKTDDLLQKLMDTKNYLPATKYSVSALYFKFFQLEREVFYILNCLATVCSLPLSALPYTSSFCTHRHSQVFLPDTVLMHIAHMFPALHVRGEATQM